MGGIVGNDRPIRWFFVSSDSELGIGVICSKEHLAFLFYKWCFGLRWDSVIEEMPHG